MQPSVGWLRYLGGSGVDDVCCTALDGQGNLWVAGTTSDSISWRTGSTIPIRIGSGGLTDAFVARFRSSGELTLLVFIGGQGGDTASGLACMADGGVIVVGTTGSADFPVTTGALERQLLGAADAFVAKVGTVGDLQWATFLGGSNWDKGLGIAAMADGSVVVGGSTSSSDFPAVNPLQAPGSAGADDGFLAVLSPDGSHLAFSTHLGGSSGLDEVRGVAVDSQDAIVAVGQTGSADFPVLHAYQNSFGGGLLMCSADAFVTKVSWPSAQLVFSTYLGGRGADGADAVAVDGNDQLTIVGGTISPDFPSVSGSYTAPPTVGNLFVTKMAADGSSLVFSSRFPVNPSGAGLDCVLAPHGFRVRSDPSDQSWTAGFAHVPDFPLVDPLQTELRGPGDGVLTVLSSDGTHLLFSTYLGGTGIDALRDVAVGPTSDVFVAGYTESADLPASQGSYRGAGDAFVAHIKLAAESLAAGASASPLSGLAPLIVSFSASATGGTGIYVFDWDFGDASVHSAEQNPSHTYSVGGDYVATVTVTDSASASASASVTVSVTPTCWVACTASVPLAAGAGQAVAFAASATPADCSGTVSYAWDFGDGQSSTLQNPSHAYLSAGLYTWSLTATIGAASCTRSGTIVVTTAPVHFSSLIPALAHKPGFYGSQWRADVTVLNPNDAAANLTLVYLSGSAPVLRTVVLSGHTTVEWADVLVALFDLPEEASTSGFVQVISDVPVASIGRSYNLSDGGTFGGTFPALTAADGTLVAERELTLQPWENLQDRLERLLGLEVGSLPEGIYGLTVLPLDDPAHRLQGRSWAYVALVDNVTGDPTHLW